MLRTRMSPCAQWTALLFGGIWILLFRSLAVHWSASEQYSYGWLVPILAFCLGIARWKSRPPASDPLPAGRWLAFAAVVLFFPTWMLVQPNPDWRLLSWVMTAEVILITLGAVAATGGIVWVRHLLFPCLFVLTAVPWPRPLEIELIARLTQGVTWVSVELLNLTGVRAVQSGSVIEVRGGQLGVEEACSGIQSLQAALMASLFFGEFLHLNKKRRVLLVAFGISAALATNIGRSYFLAVNTSHTGLSAVAKWHDPAANVALLACLVAVWAMASLMSGPATPTSARSTEPPVSRASLSPRFLGVLTAWLAAVIVVTEIWYYDAGTSQENQWTLTPPAHSDPIPISRQVAEQLQADEIVSGKWNDSEGYGLQLYFFRWAPGPPRSRLLARLHRPEVCLPSIGLKLVEDRGSVTAGPPELPIEFRALTFDANGFRLFVYTGTWESRTPRSENREKLSDSLSTAAFQSVLWRERNLGQQVVELAISGCGTAMDADAALKRTIPDLLKRSSSSERKPD